MAGTAKIPARVGLAAFDFPTGTLLFTEASGKKRASLHLVRGAAGLEAHQRGGLEPLEATAAQFREALTRESHTLKRALTDPRRYRQPCPACGAPVQRIRYAENEVNYCARCQTGGRVLADRGMSRLLKDDWPRSLDEWEAEMGFPR
jgi:formamidopyrimidine-DNA glycosylase